jgi:hypothetical protein
MKRTAFVLVVILSAVGFGTYVRAQQMRVGYVYATNGQEHWTLKATADTGPITTAGAARMLDVAWHDVVITDPSGQLQIHADQATFDKDHSEWVLQGNVRISAAK